MDKWLHSSKVILVKHYCKFGNFCENKNLENSVKRHISHFKNSRLGHDLPASVNDTAISPFLKDFIFTKLRICAYGKFRENKILVKISEFTVNYLTRLANTEQPLRFDCSWKSRLNWLRHSSSLLERQWPFFLEFYETI